jgi:hypothetical protein
VLADVLGVIADALERLGVRLEVAPHQRRGKARVECFHPDQRLVQHVAHHVRERPELVDAGQQRAAIGADRARPAGGELPLDARTHPAEQLPCALQGVVVVLRSMVRHDHAHANYPALQGYFL